MPSLKLDEPMADAVIAKLKTGMPARIAAINAERNDSVVLAAPGADDYFVGGVTALARAPAIIVTTAGGEFEIESAAGFQLDAEIRVYVVDGDMDRQNLTRRLMRLMRAVIECVLLDAPQKKLVDPNGATVAHRVFPVGWLPGPVEDPTDDQPEWRTARMVAFSVRNYEE